MRVYRQDTKTSNNTEPNNFETVFYNFSKFIKPSIHAEILYHCYKFSILSQQEI